MSQPRINNSFRSNLIKIMKMELRLRNDPSHDYLHALRVLDLSEYIAKKEQADLDIIIPAAIFHDIINYPKNHPKRLESQNESADYAEELLSKYVNFPKDKIKQVGDAIRICSFSKGIVPKNIEAKILQDADSLEATGAISIMRTFSSAGMLNRPFYNQEDPFCKNRKPDDNKYSLDLFFSRLLVVKDRLHTKTAKTIAKNRHEFLLAFVDELYNELLSYAE